MTRSKGDSIDKEARGQLKAGRIFHWVNFIQKQLREMCLGLPTFDNIAFSAPREIRIL